MTTQQQAGDPQAADRLTRVEALLEQLVERVGEMRQEVREDLAFQRSEIGTLRAEINTLRSDMDAKFQRVNDRIDRLMYTVMAGEFVIIAGGIGAVIAYFLGA